MKRCPWCLSNDLYIKYHDDEWGVPIHDDKKHLEFLILEGAQAGLSWLTILKKRENYREAYDKFEVNKIAEYDKNKISQLLNNKGIIRNRNKINSSITNAKRFLEIQEEFGSFGNYIWSFLNFKPIINCWKEDSDVPSKTKISDIISNDLKNRGFKFVGSKTIYAHMQSTGLINDHIVSCFRYNQLIK